MTQTGQVYLVSLLALGVWTGCFENGDGGGGDGDRPDDGGLPDSRPAYFDLDCFSECAGYCDSLAACVSEVPPDCLKQCSAALAPTCGLGDISLLTLIECDLLLPDACARGVLTDGCSEFPPPCEDYCGELCAYATQCGSELAADECERECRSVRKDEDCIDLEAPDRTPCDQALQQVECSGYCEALCTAAADCVTLDVDRCTERCLQRPVAQCKQSSIAPRSCSQLRAEALCYDPPSLTDGTCWTGDVGTGLCLDSGDCASSEACDVETGLCGACSSDAQCETGRREAFAGFELFDRPWACQEGSCVQLECGSDSQCGLDSCDLETHTCVECVLDSDCYGGGCNLETHTCVACTQNSHCQGMYFGGGACDLSTFSCVQCLEDAQCTGSLAGLKACKPSTRSCVQCVTDDHCADGFGSSKTCNPASNRCVECLDPSDCEAGQTCDDSLHCVSST